MQWRDGIVKGWYSYDSRQAKIPLMGYYNGSDSFERLNQAVKEYYFRVSLFVPENYFQDTQRSEDCGIRASAEQFFSNSYTNNFTTLQWTDSKRALPVQLQEVHPAVGSPRPSYKFSTPVRTCTASTFPP